MVWDYATKPLTMESTAKTRVHRRRNGVGLTHVWMFAVVLTWHISRVDSCSGITCSQCIQSGGECAWCSDTNFTTIAGERCGLRDSLKGKGCSSIQSPETKETSREDKPVTDGDDAEGTDALQIQPQAMRIQLRPRGKGHSFDVTFRPANNFPVDLYFLFDLSKTMEDLVEDLSKLANGIAEEIGKISKNYRMGYGTFQDKVILPFTSTHPAKLRDPCPKGNDCSPPFDFRHELNLTRNLPSFIEAVNRSQTTGNIDIPEGGFDAMLQAIVCKSAVGWRDNSRQLIIFASDARMHFAGDGKLAGLIAPNDGQCHLVGKEYTMAEEQDYPSVGQISAELDKSKKYVIFAVADKVLGEYQQLHKRVPRSSVNVLKKGKDSNVVDIVRDKYRSKKRVTVPAVQSNVEDTAREEMEMTKGVELEYETSSKDIRVMITPTCKDKDPEGSCNNVVIGKKVAPFVVNIRADRCPEDPRDRVQSVIIRPSDFLVDVLNVTVEIVCDCLCESSPDDTPVPDEDCSNGNGTIECGICSCFQGRYGSTCECGQGDADSVDTNTCNKDGFNSTAPDCSGVGECLCGVCQCQPNFSGQFCECNEAVCPIFDNLVCAGNGECQCEACKCGANFTGLACECPLNSDTCTPPETESNTTAEVCSGHGACSCGTCVCEDGYIGRYCQTCFLCGNSVCEVDTYRECALCEVLPAEHECPNACPNVTVVSQVNTADEQFEICRDWLTEECHVRFAVINPGPDASLHVQKAKVCAEAIDIVTIVLGVVGGVVGVGLLLLILFKILTMLFDHLEYQHFQRELQSPKWARHNNPIYKEPTTTYYNPVMASD